MSDSVPGWYPTKDGLRWWDGENWGPYGPDAAASTTTHVGSSTASPSALEFSSVPDPKGRGLGCFGWFFVIGMVTVIGFIAVGISSNNSPVSGGTSSESANSSVTESPAESAPVKSESEIRDEYMVEQGFSVSSSGETYMRAATEEEKAGSSCGYSKCIDYILYSHSGCPSGFYIKGDILSGGTAVGWTNEISASVMPQESIVVRLNDHQNMGDQMRISEVTCMG